MEDKIKHEVEVKTPHLQFSFKNLPPKVSILLAGAIFILALAIAYSFVKGWSTINVRTKKVVEEVQQMEKEIEEKIKNSD